MPGILEGSYAATENRSTRHDPMRAGDHAGTIAGKCSGGCLGELRRAIDRARRAQKQIVIDMSEVTLVDRPSLEFLAAQVRENITLVSIARLHLNPDFKKKTA